MVNRDAVASFSPRLPLRLPWERSEFDQSTAMRLRPTQSCHCALVGKRSRTQPFQGWQHRQHRRPKVAATATLGWRM